MTSTIPSATTITTTLHNRKNNSNLPSFDTANGNNNKKIAANNGRVSTFDPSYKKWTSNDMKNLVKSHSLPCFLGLCLVFLVVVECTLNMIPATSPPFDLGFIATRRLNQLLSSWPQLNTLLAFLNTVVLVAQMMYILWAWLIEGRTRATISGIFMFTCRGILGYSTQLPLPQGFLGSGADLPVGNSPFFLFFSGHVGISVLVSLDLRRVQRWELAWTFDILNVLQAIRLLATRGHYTIDLAIGAGAAIFFDSLAGKYEKNKRRQALIAKEASFLS